MRQFFFILFLLFLQTNVGAKDKKVYKEKDVQKLYQMMQGFYSSNEQSIADSSYFDIRLKMVPIWSEKTGEYWLYVEQAMSTTEDKPYRQRIYKVALSDDKTQLTSTVYTIKDGEKYYGAWKDISKLKDLKVSDLEVRNGCTIFMKRTKKGFEGSTNKQDCESNLRGAKYATSIVKIKKSKVVSWDQGFDLDNKQVWGAVKGGYIFERMK
jgi:CpeT protein